MDVLYGSQKEIEITWKNSLMRGWRGIHFVNLVLFAMLNVMVVAMDYVRLLRHNPHAASLILAWLPVFVISHVIFAFNMRKLYKSTRVAMNAYAGKDLNPLLYESYYGYRNYVHVLGISFIILGICYFIIATC